MGSFPNYQVVKLGKIYYSDDALWGERGWGGGGVNNKNDDIILEYIFDKYDSM